MEAECIDKGCTGERHDMEDFSVSQIRLSFCHQVSQRKWNAAQKHDVEDKVNIIT